MPSLIEIGLVILEKIKFEMTGNQKSSVELQLRWAKKYKKLKCAKKYKLPQPKLYLYNLGSYWIHSLVSESISHTIGQWKWKSKIYVYWMKSYYEQPHCNLLINIATHVHDTKYFFLIYLLIIISIYQTRHISCVQKLYENNISFFHWKTF